MEKKINFFDFSDINIDMKNPRDKSRCFCEAVNKVIIPTQEHKSHIERLHAVIKRSFDATGRREMRVNYMDSIYRCTVMPAGGGIVMCRKQPMVAYELSDLDIPEKIKEFVLDQRLSSGGLILVVGANGVGKTTTCVAMAKERIAKFGGLLLTIEDPIELSMAGDIGDGYCVQCEVNSDKELAEVGKLALRCFPTKKSGVLFIGEIRDAEMATLALRASQNGLLVIATIHAFQIEAALRRIVDLASDKISEEMARSLLCDGFRLGLHQKKLEKNRLDLEFLLDTPITAGIISKGAFEQLGSEIYSQKMKVLNNGFPTTRTF
ncbi:ATPase, T2SS/T4P/T4SS family [Photobacterium damselae]|uniref:ATPase, T2SS/T4P/T4SS family n=1 Tax=Photobacterium damselae TaxID=38293 RepID=UPI0040696699